MSAVRLSWLLFFIEFFIICCGDRVIIGKGPGHQSFHKGYWNEQKLPSDELAYENLAENEIPNRVGFVDYGFVNLESQPSPDFVFPDDVFVPLPEKLNAVFSANDRVPIENGDKYFYKVLRKEEIPEYINHPINTVPKFIPNLDGRQAIDIPIKKCPEGERRDPSGRCRLIIRRR